MENLRLQVWFENQLYLKEQRIQAQVVQMWVELYSISIRISEYSKYIIKYNILYSKIYNEFYFSNYICLI